MDWVSICLGSGIILQIIVNIRLISSLSAYIEEMLREIVEDLPPALGESMKEGLGNAELMSEVNPIQMAIAQIIPKMFESPEIQAKVIERSSDGKFQ
jgi:hypothetical protein